MGLAPNFGLKFNQSNDRIGTYVAIPSFAGPSSRYKTLKENSIFIEGPKVYNCLPKILRNYTGPLDRFKEHLDKFLQIIPDHPNGDMMSDAVDWSCKASNSLKDWIRQLCLSNWSSDKILKDQGLTKEDDVDDTEEIDDGLEPCR